MRSYLIEDEGDLFEVSFMQDEEKVGAAIFPEGGTFDAFSMARDMGEEWLRSVPRVTRACMRLN